MKYNAEVERENRNNSPKNDLLRNLKCVGIIQLGNKTRVRFQQEKGAMVCGYAFVWNVLHIDLIMKFKLDECICEAGCDRDG